MANDHNMEPPMQSLLVVPDYSSGLLTSIRDLFQQGSLCDYTIVVDGERLAAHRLILASVSDYFRAMLAADMMEAQQHEVELKGVTGRAMSTLLDFAYCGELRLCLDTITEVLAAANYLQMAAATTLCCEFLIRELGIHTAVDVYKIGVMFSLNGIKNRAVEHIIENFETVATTEQFMKLDVVLLCELLASNQLEIHSELILFKHVERWLQHDTQKRAKCAFQLMQHIRFPLMTPEMLVDEVSSSPFMKELECRQFLEEGLTYHALPARQPLLQSARTQIRQEPCIITLAFCSSKLQAFRRGRWFTVPNTTLPRPSVNYWRAQVTVVENYMYICGGKSGQLVSNTCYRYDPRTGKWTQLRDMLVCRMTFTLLGVAGPPGQLFAFGGYTRDMKEGGVSSPTDEAEVYSVKDNAWSPISPLPDERVAASACQCDGLVYLSGGCKANETLSTLWCYNPPTNKDSDPEVSHWEMRAPMLRTHAKHAMLAVDKCIYVVDSNFTSVEKYSPTTDQWTLIKESRTGISKCHRPTVMPPWVYFLFYTHSDASRGPYLSARYNVITGVFEELSTGDYPEKGSYEVLACALTIPNV